MVFPLSLSLSPSFMHLCFIGVIDYGLPVNNDFQLRRGWKNDDDDDDGDVTVDDDEACLPHFPAKGLDCSGMHVKPGEQTNSLPASIGEPVFRSHSAPEGTEIFVGPVGGDPGPTTTHVPSDCCPY